MRIIDTHAHLGLSASDGACGRLDELLSNMEQCRIERTIIFPIDSEAPGGTYEAYNDEILRIVSEHPHKLSGLCRVQPKAGKKAQKELTRCWKAGLKGVKIHPRSEDFVIEDCHEVFEAAHDLKCPVILHTENGPKNNPKSWQPLFKKYSEAIFILSHGGKDHYRAAAKIAGEMPNVYLDSSTLSYRRTFILLEIAGAKKILFASDYPYSHQALELKKYELLVDDKDVLRMIMFENAERLWRFPK